MIEYKRIPPWANWGGLFLILAYFAIIYFVVGLFYFSTEETFPVSITEIKGPWIVLSIDEDKPRVMPVLGTKCSIGMADREIEGVSVYSLHHTIILFIKRKSQSQTIEEEKTGILSYKKNTIQLIKETITKTNNHYGEQ